MNVFKYVKMFINFKSEIYADAHLYLPNASFKCLSWQFHVLCLEFINILTVNLRLDGRK